MQRLIAPVVIASLALITACDRAAEFKSAIPQRDNVQLRVPESNGQALTAGEIAPLYEATLGIAVSVNLGVLWVFGIIDLIISQPPTTLEDNVAVWGPTEPEGLERLSYQFTVEKVGDGQFVYKLEARPKGEEGDFTVIFDGEAQPERDNDGTGTLTYHLGSLRELNDRDECLTGNIKVAYDAASEPRSLDVVFDQVANVCLGETPTNAHYVYAEALDKSGQMDFAIEGNAHRADENKPGLEVFSVRSRWLSTGAGRSDVRVSGDEIAADLQANIPGTPATSVDVVECWDDAFKLQFADTSPDEMEPHLDHALTGDAASCAFADASHAEL